MAYTPENTIEKPSLYSPLTLAFVGDGVYELFVRTKLTEAGNLPASKLHKMAIGFVCARAQAKSMYEIEKLLTPKEMEIYKRGRNAKSPTVPKNADLTEYRVATGFEALMGYLYLGGEADRLSELMNISFNAVHEAVN